MDRTAIAAEMDDVLDQLRALLAAADPAGLRRRSNGTRWSNRQLIYHSVFGYLVVRAGTGGRPGRTRRPGRSRECSIKIATRAGLDTQCHRKRQ